MASTNQERVGKARRLAGRGDGRVGPDASRIADAVISHPAGHLGTEVTVPPGNRGGHLGRCLGNRRFARSPRTPGCARRCSTASQTGPT